MEEEEPISHVLRDNVQYLKFDLNVYCKPCFEPLKKRFFSDVL